METPTPDQIRAAREAAGMTQQEAAEAVYRGERQRWNEWESGRIKMPLAEWHLFLLLTGQAGTPNAT